MFPESVYGKPTKFSTMQSYESIPNDIENLVKNLLGFEFGEN